MMRDNDLRNSNRPHPYKRGSEGSEPAFFNNGGSFERDARKINPNTSEMAPNHILLMTVMNPTYPITVDVINTICGKTNQVLRIVIFRKNGVQAMVEFDSIEAAVNAKESLNGADIYAGCCTLKIDFAKPSKLNVFKNDSDSWDYTNPSLGPSRGQQPRGYGLIDPPPYREERYTEMKGNSYRNYGERFEQGRGNQGSYMHNVSRGGPNAPSQGPVLMVYGLNSEMTCNKVFNLFCLYGNVMKVKFLKTIKGGAMVQMGGPQAVDFCIAHLNNFEFQGQELQLGYSKQPFLSDVGQPYELFDGSLSFKDFSESPNNRFSTPQAAAKNRLQSPSKVLHFFNVPPTITEDGLKEIFIDNNCIPPASVTLSLSKSEKSATGLMQFDDLKDALIGLVTCNHLDISNPAGKNPYVMKLCFSSTRASLV